MNSVLPAQGKPSQKNDSLGVRLVNSRTDLDRINTIEAIRCAKVSPSYQTTMLENAEEDIRYAARYEDESSLENVVTQNYQKAIDAFLILANKHTNNPEAQLRLGNAYLHGHYGISKDSKRAIYFFSQAYETYSKAGTQPDANDVLAKLAEAYYAKYKSEHGCFADLENAKSKFKEASEAGNGRAHAWMAKLLIADGGSSHITADYLLKADKANYSFLFCEDRIAIEVIFNLSEWYRIEARNNPGYRDKADKLLKMAAKLGHEEAIANDQLLQNK